ncbi:hypothetical protein Y919_12065 [Caloranaerobacter azorensis H53214]|uniref:Lipoprotein n=1 Tax=Caloranaerobacter azorensis H53214 TaxID=1156417 RepID=A0A096DJH4_9FIRM|nr:hypothetical protein [Caloranaerobacter azorensis]KGG79441.1 hypothetical protein Y919_12065 [Caloranaerobacter azorensis H53214]
MNILVNTKKRYIILLLGLSILLSSCLNDTINTNNTKINIKDYVPKNNLVKVFNGGFEGYGKIYIVNKINENMYQINQIDYGTGLVSIYEKTNDYIKLIYRSEVDSFDKNYLNKKLNKNDIVLQTPIKVGTNWKNEDNTKYEITGVDVDVNTPSGYYSTLEVTIRKNDIEIKKYYAKGIGLVKSISNGHVNEELVKIETLDSKVILNSIKELNNLLVKYLGDI